MTEMHSLMPCFSCSNILCFLDDFFWLMSSCSISGFSTEINHLLIYQTTYIFINIITLSISSYNYFLKISTYIKPYALGKNVCFVHSWVPEPSKFLVYGIWKAMCQMNTLRSKWMNHFLWFAYTDPLLCIWCRFPLPKF